MSPSQAERSEATRAALLGAARSLFAERGYAAVTAEEVVRAAGVTRGAMYHHFRDKKDLFRAVHEQVEEEMVAAIAEAVGRTGARPTGGECSGASAGRAPLAGREDVLDLLEAGVDAFLDRCLDPVVARIALEEAPSVLGWREWREIDARYALGLVSGVLGAAMDAGSLHPQPVTPLAHMVLSACGEAGLLIAASDDPAAMRDEVRGPLLAMLAGLRA